MSIPFGQNLLAIASREKPYFFNQINVICPVQPPPQKYSRSRIPQITLTIHAVPSR